jgi:hypothetical protein
VRSELGAVLRASGRAAAAATELTLATDLEQKLGLAPPR